VNLIVADTMAKALTLGNIARSAIKGTSWASVATGGFWMDFHKGSLGVNLETLEPKLSIRNWNDLNNILLKAIDADVVYIATSDDPRGDIMAYYITTNIYQKFPEKVVKRIRLSELTPGAFAAAVQVETPVDIKVVEAFESRMVLDRLITFRLGQAIGFVLGRAMLPVLQILDGASPVINCVARFEGATEFWSDPMTSSEATKLADAIRQDPPQSFQREFLNADLAPPPYLNADDLIREGTKALRVRGSEVLAQAKSLYETGFITDPLKAERHLDLSFFSSVIARIRELAGSNYCGRLLEGDNLGRECVRPTKIEVEPSSVPVPVRNLYRLIWGRTLASCSIPATIRREFVRFSVGDYVMTAVGSRLVVDGYRRVEVGSPTFDINNIPEDLVFKDAEAVEHCDLTEASILRAVKRVIPEINVAAVIKALENNHYVVFEGLNVTITAMGRNLLAVAREKFPEMLWPEFLIQSDARLHGIEKGTLSRVEALVDYCRWIDSKIPKAAK